MAKEELGTKRECPETGKRFYDLGKDPIVSPYTGKEYPLTFFEGEPDIPAPDPAPEEKKSDDDLEVVAAVEPEGTITADGPEIISLEDAEDDDDDDDVDDDGEEIPDIPDIEVDVDDDDDEEDNTFLEDDDDDDDDLSDVIGAVPGDDDET